MCESRNWKEYCKQAEVLARELQAGTRQLNPSELKNIRDYYPCEKGYEHLANVDLLNDHELRGR